MSTLSLFSRYYNAEILRRSGGNSRLGDLYDWAGIFNQRLKPVGFNVIDFVEADMVARIKWRADADAAPLFPANFVDIIDMTKNLSVGVKPDLPNLPVELAAELTTKKVLNFQFEGVVQRTMPEEQGIALRLLIEQFKGAQSAEYHKRLRPYDLAVTLYYAQKVVLRLDTSQHVSVAATTAVENIGGTVKVDAAGHQELRFSRSDIPFAVTLKATQAY